MRCYNCKAAIPDDARFCPVCGRPQVIDRGLIDAAIGGDQSAMTDLYNRTYNAVYNTVRFMVKDEDAALDILQDSYIKAFESLGQLQDAGRFEPWIKRITHNKAIDYLRAEKAIPFSGMVSDDSEEALEFEDDRPENLPEVVMDRRETTRLINEILDSLPADQRVCISLFYYDQLSVKEIAEELNISEATVKSRLQYGRKKIETQVRALEKKGTKLYGLAPIPLLMLLLHGQDLIGRAPSAAVLQNVLAGGSGQGMAGPVLETAGNAPQVASGSVQAAVSTGQVSSTAAQTASVVGQAAAKTAVKHAALHAAGKALAVKITAAVAAVAVVAGGTVAAVNHFRGSGQNGADTVITQPADTKEALPAPTVPESSAEVTLPTRPVPETPPMPPMPPEPPEPETEETTTAERSWQEAYQALVEDCRKDVEENGSMDAQFLSRYRVYHYRDFYYEMDSTARELLQYAVHDVNRDGTPELVLATYAYPGVGKQKGCIAFEVYTFDGMEVIPLFWNARESIDWLELVYVAEDGKLWCTSGNSGHNPTYIFELPPNGTALKQTHYFDPIEGTSDFRMIVDGVEIRTMSMFEFWHEWIAEDAILDYHDIWDDLPAGD